jgi:acetyl esterase/lipase
MFAVALAWTFLLATAASSEDAPSSEDAYFFDSLVSRTMDFCYTELEKDDACCMDKTIEPDVQIDTVSRDGTSWTCDPAVCYDTKVGPRGDDQMFIPKGASCSTPRILYVHGGSWMYGSPTTDSYPQLLSKLADFTGFVIFAPDYPLAPIGNFSSVRAFTLEALNYLAIHGPGCTNAVADAPPLFIGGDSSGGGSAMAALLTLVRSPKLLHGGRLKLSGGFFYSPWTN